MFHDYAAIYEGDGKSPKVFVADEVDLRLLTRMVELSW